MIEISDKLELHYLFRDDTHSIDAFIRNECEKELLEIFLEVSETLGLEIRVEANPTLEGGFKEIWSFLGKNSVQITLIIGVTTMVLTRFPVENKELTRLQIENLKLDNAIKRRELEKLNLEFIQSEEELKEEIVKQCVELVNKNYKVSWRKSNLYRRLLNYPKIESIEVQRIKGKSPSGPPRNVPKKEFSKFILRTDDLPDTEKETHVIDVISPAIKSGRFKWKGFLNNEIITFEMNDTRFNQHVMKGEAHFSNRFSIEVEMNQSRKIDKDGSIRITNTVVHQVIATIEEGVRKEFSFD